MQFYHLYLCVFFIALSNQYLVPGNHKINMVSMQATPSMPLTLVSDERKCFKYPKTIHFGLEKLLRHIMHLGEPQCNVVLDLPQSAHGNPAKLMTIDNMSSFRGRCHSHPIEKSEPPTELCGNTLVAPEDGNILSGHISFVLSSSSMGPVGSKTYL